MRKFVKLIIEEPVSCILSPLLLILVINNPLRASLLLIFLSLSIAYYISLYLIYSWISIILCLIYLGGVLLLIVWIRAIAGGLQFTKRKILYVIPLILTVYVTSNEKELNQQYDHFEQIRRFGRGGAVFISLVVCFMILLLVLLGLIFSSYNKPFRFYLYSLSKAMDF